ncbi:unnamed protein product [Peronospora destructor]|uniref:Uncharacterized protein n=1 Tax=Peronospora destructor TaxID=86335 RepID=A0AAV0THI3_9STRA|nr:unnamed protein product [Peronospora destructor]
MSHFPPTSRRLSDGLVLPRVPADNHDADVVDTMTPYYWSRRTASPLVSLHHESNSKGKRPLRFSLSLCRANQARYRDKQKNTELAFEKSVEQLHQELEILKRRYRDVSSHERSNQSPWLIAAEVFRLIETGFRSPWSIASTQEMKNHTSTRQIVVILERAFAHDVAMGELRGIDALMDQLRLYSDYFDKPNLQLERIESVGPVLSAQAKLSVTVTEFTLGTFFLIWKSQHVITKWKLAANICTSAYWASVLNAAAW